MSYPLKRFLKIEISMMMIMMMMAATIIWVLGECHAVLRVLHRFSQLSLTLCEDPVIILLFITEKSGTPERLTCPSFSQLVSKEAGTENQTVWFQCPNSLACHLKKIHHLCLPWFIQIRLRFILNLYFSAWCSHCSLHVELKWRKRYYLLST